MIPAIIAVWALAAPAGYLAGAVWCSKNNRPEAASYLPFMCAAIPPMGTIIALVVITQTETGDKE